MANNDGQIVLGLDIPKTVSQINADIKKLQGQLDQVKATGALDTDSTVQQINSQITKLQAQLKTIDIQANIDINDSVKKSAQQSGQQLGKEVSQGFSKSTSKATEKIVRDFSQLNDFKRQFIDNHEIISKEDIADVDKFYSTIRQAFSEFGQVTISKGEMSDGYLENLKVKIQQVNGELKTTREFMLYLSKEDNFGNSFKLIDDDTIKTAETMVHHLDESKHLTNATADEANALKEQLAEADKYYGKLKQASKEQLAIEKQRITAGEKQLEILDKQSKRRDSRITYNENQIEKKGLTDNSRKREINDLVYAGHEKYDESWAKEIDKNIKSLSKLKDKWEEQGIYVDKFKLKVDELAQSLNNIDSGDVKGLNNIRQQMEKLKTEASQIVEVNKIQHSLDTGKYDVQVSTLENRFQKWGLTIDETNVKMKSLKEAYDTLQKADTTDAKIQAEKEYQLVLEKTTNEYKKMSLESTSRTERTNLSNKLQVWLEKNTKASNKAKTRLEEFIDILDSTDDIGVPALKNIKQEFTEIEIAERAAGRMGKGWIDTMKAGMSKFVEWALASGSIMEIKEIVTHLTDTSIELNTVVTDLTMATGINENQVEALTESYSKLGDSLNATLTDVIESGTEWIKQGQSIADTETLISNAMILSKIGKLTSAEATEYLTSAMKGYQVSVEDTLGVVDKLSAVDMASATDVGGLAEGMSGVAASAELAGVSMDKLLGYLAAVGEVTQEGMSQTGTTFNAIFSRMGNIKLSRLTDYETGEDLSNVETVLRGVGISLRDSQNSFRDFDEVLDETASRWASFSETQQRAIASAFSGTHHLNEFIILMENYDNALKYTEVSMESSGEAMQKFETYQKSVTAHVELFNKAVQDLANTAIDSGLINFFVDLGTFGVKAADGLVNLLSPLGTLATSIGLFASIKNVGTVQ